jgi:hypothetical protein
MASGVAVQPDCITTFNDIKLGHKFRYIVYSLTDDLTQIRVLKTAPPAAVYDDFVEDLKEAETLRQCRYGIFDAQYQLSDGQQRTKLVFFLWSPEDATVKQKMLYTSSKDALKKSLRGIGKEIQACDYGDLAWSSVMEVLLRTEVAH